MILLAQISDSISLVDKAAGQSDRWLFLAALVVIMFAGSVAIRWLVNSLTAKDAVHIAERKELIAEIKAEHLECRAARKEDQALFLQSLDSKNKTIEANTKAVEALTSIIVRHDADMRAAHEVELKALIRSEMEKSKAAV